MPRPSDLLTLWLATGHSLGAGVAATVALLLHTGDYDFAPFECIAAAPPSIFSVSLVYLTRDVIKSVVVDHDMIPRYSSSATCTVNLNARTYCLCCDSIYNDIRDSTVYSEAVDIILTFMPQYIWRQLIILTFMVHYIQRQLILVTCRTSVANVDKLIHEIVSSSTRSKAIDFFTSTYAKERKEKMEDLLMNDDKDRHFAPGTLLAVSTQETEVTPAMQHQRV